MKKLLVLAIVFALILPLTGCNGGDDEPEARSGEIVANDPRDETFDGHADATDDTPSGGDDGDVVFIRDRFFMTETLHIIINSNEYLGRTIRYEGLFREFVSPSTGNSFYAVIRTTPGCCGDDGIIGFEVYMGDIKPFEQDAWVEITGVLDMFESGGFEFPALRAVSIRELDVRGQEFVTQ